MNYDELSELGKDKMKERFSSFGFDITSLYIENLSLPVEVEKVIDKRTSMSVIGDMNQYQQYQAAEAIREAARNEGGGLAGTGAGIGAGAAIGSVMANAFQGNQQQTNSPSAQQPAKVTCPHCQALIHASAKFCGECGKTVQQQKVPCISCQAAINEDAKFCGECGAQQVTEKTCAKCGKVNAPNTKFCGDCGDNLQQ